MSWFVIWDNQCEHHLCQEHPSEDLARDHKRMLNKSPDFTGIRLAKEVRE